MGWFSDTTNVKNETTVENDVFIDLENIIDTSGFESLLAGFREMFERIFGQQQEQAEATAQQQANTSAQAQALLLLQTAVENEKNKELAEANNTFKRLVAGVLIIGAIWVVFRKGK